jgi:hypothetical protein
MNPDGGRVDFNTLVVPECGDGMQTEEHIFWDCKLYEYKMSTMLGNFSGNSKKD